MKAKALTLAAFCGLTVALALALTAGSASADPAFHTKFSFSDVHSFPAGTQCDFNYQDAFTVGVDFTALSNGASTTVLTEYVTHTNLDTGYSLTDVDHVTIESPPGSSTVINAGIFWHLRDPSGKLVLVKAGEATFDTSTGQLIKFTPNSAQDQTTAQVICPALGGNPA